MTNGLYHIQAAHRSEQARPAATRTKLKITGHILTSALALWAILLSVWFMVSRFYWNPIPSNLAIFFLLPSAVYSLLACWALFRLWTNRANVTDQARP